MDMNAWRMSAPSVGRRGTSGSIRLAWPAAQAVGGTCRFLVLRRMDDAPLFIPEDWKPTLEMTVGGSTLELRLTGLNAAMLQKAIETLQGLRLVYAAAEEL